MTAVGDTDSSLAIKCLAFCQSLTNQGMEINFSLTISSTFSFSFDTRQKAPLALATKKKKKKKASPSTLRRNARRREDFLKKKRCPAAVTPISSATASKPVPVTNNKSDGDEIPLYQHESLITALLSPGKGEEPPVFTEQALEVEVPPNYIPSPPPCSICRRRGYWELSRIDSQRSWHHLYICCGQYAKLVTPPDTAQFIIPVHVDWLWGLWYNQFGYCKSLLFLENHMWLLKRINIDWLIDCVGNFYVVSIKHGSVPSVVADDVGAVSDYKRQ